MDSNTHVKCMICGAIKKELNGHIRMHNMSADDYKKQFPNALMSSVSSKLAKLNGIKGKKRKKPNFSQEDLERRRQTLKNKWARLKEEMGEEAYFKMKKKNADKMRAAKGPEYTHSENTKEKMRGPRLHVRGKKFSKEHCDKLSIAAKTRPSKTRSQQTKEKMSDAWKRRKADIETYQKYIEGVRNRMTTPEALYRIRENVSKRLQNPALSQKQFNTSIEIKFQKWLESKNISYIHQYQLSVKSGIFTYDFFLVDLRLLVEIDGEYWHRKSLEQINRDRLKLNIAKTENLMCVRISDSDWNTNVIFLSPDEIDEHNNKIIQSRINHFLGKSS